MSVGAASGQHTVGPDFFSRVWEEGHKMLWAGHTVIALMCMCKCVCVCVHSMCVQVPMGPEVGAKSLQLEFPGGYEAPIWHDCFPLSVGYLLQ